MGSAVCQISLTMRALCAAALILLICFASKAYGSAVGLYDQALESIQVQDYSAALAQLRELQKNYPAYSPMSSVTTRIAVLQEAAVASESIAALLDALTLRDEGQFDQAVTVLDSIVRNSDADILIDDALYMLAYIQVMDRYDYAAAREALAALQLQFADSSYTDTALYLDAIAMEQQGQTEDARIALMALREKHSALSLPFHFHWPKGNALSRYWFNRADRRLTIIEARLNSASTVLEEMVLNDGILQLTVEVDGRELNLRLSSSPLIENTSWKNGALDEQLPPVAGIYHGVVEGIDDSWVRVILRDDSIRGVVSIEDERTRLSPANLTGTLDYYFPVSKNIYHDASLQYDSTIEPEGFDYLVAPDEQAAELISRTVTGQSDVRDAAVSIVVDSAYDRYYSGEGLINAINNLNVADGIYRDQGFAITLDEALQFEEEEDPLQSDSATLEEQLFSFRDYQLQYSTLFEDSALSYFFTGNYISDGTLGLAWIDTLCRSDGYDAGVTTPSSFSDVLLIHELGHSFGALHDTQTQCNTDNLTVMWPTLSESSTTKLSACAIETISRAQTKTCLGNTVDLALSASSTGSVVSFTISNTDTAVSTDVELVVETLVAEELEWPDFCQSDAPTSASCFIEQLQGSEQRTIEFPVNIEFQFSGSLVSAEVTPESVLELDDSNNLAYVNITEDSVGGELAELTTSDDTADEEEKADTVQTGAASSGGATGLALLGVLSGFIAGALISRRIRRQAQVSIQRSPMIQV